ncbi:hypothetical protein N7535_004638 [Penicillium sp. DV-2018c]|nr:hypothetical protein N7461_008219 [Penicillium sp. DV-2018c]KAJ5570978.1 hypothetical protein N7535_004638 [Penicillium sp. DV-2018c]
MSGSADRLEGVSGAGKPTNEAVIAEEVLPNSSHKFFRKLASSVRKFLDKKIGKSSSRPELTSLRLDSIATTASLSRA